MISIHRTWNLEPLKLGPFPQRKPRSWRQIYISNIFKHHFLVLITVVLRRWWCFQRKIWGPPGHLHQDTIEHTDLISSDWVQLGVGHVTCRTSQLVSPRSLTLWTSDESCDHLDIIWVPILSRRLLWLSLLATNWWIWHISTICRL
jgi:hypothetical protein